MILSVNIAGVEWKSPITTAAGIVNSGKEYGTYTDLSILGALTTKGVSLDEWMGDTVPRITETYGGMLNSIGVQNPGVENFIKNDITFLKNLNANVIVNVCGHEIKEYVSVVERLNSVDGIDMIELNLSPLNPDTENKWANFGRDIETTTKIVSEVRKVTKIPLIVKLSPNNLSDIVEISKAAEAAGADALSMINTLIGVRIDIFRKKPSLGNKIGGLSGPSVKPVAVGAVYRVAKSDVKIPIIGMGGITNAEDALEFILAGATAIGVGTANFGNPRVTMNILDGIKQYMSDNNIDDINKLVGAALNS
ncbi:MAG: dihydroorotate dehydrogenase [Defluviitaleaceae bacterium]|nr:dihydroorotate dehydrogenase [Defluviitaleaceae bacterium]